MTETKAVDALALDAAIQRWAEYYGVRFTSAAGIALVCMLQQWRQDADRFPEKTHDFSRS